MIGTNHCGISDNGFGLPYLPLDEIISMSLKYHGGVLRMKLFLKIVLTAVFILALVIGSGVFYITRGLDTGADLVIGGADLNTLGDSEYKGAYESGRFSNEVSVTVKDHKITGIELVKDVTFSKPEVYETLFNRVMEKQSIEVDTVSGATVTSKAYLKAIENALTGR